MAWAPEDTHKVADCDDGWQPLKQCAYACLHVQSHCCMHTDATTLKGGREVGRPLARTQEQSAAWSQGDCQAYAAMAPLKDQPAAGRSHSLSSAALSVCLLVCLVVLQRVLQVNICHDARMSNVAGQGSQGTNTSISQRACCWLTPGAQDGQGRLMLHRPALPPLARD
jgi:hypothetical protein